MSDAQNKALAVLEKITPALAQAAARLMLVRMVELKAANPGFVFGLHKAAGLLFDQSAAVIFCSGCPDDNVMISIQDDGRFEAVFGDLLVSSPENVLTGNGHNEADRTRVMSRIQHGRLTGYEIN